MRRAISIESLLQALTNQRSYMLALSNTDLTPYQLSALCAIYNENEKLESLLGLQVPTLGSLVKRHNEIVFLEKLYQESSDEESTEDGTIEPIQVQTSQQEICGVTRVECPEVRGNET
jgi:hypothetical protein